MTTEEILDQIRKGLEAVAPSRAAEFRKVKSPEDLDSLGLDSITTLELVDRLERPRRRLHRRLSDGYDERAGPGGRDPEPGGVTATESPAGSPRRYSPQLRPLLYDMVQGVIRFLFLTLSHPRATNLEACPRQGPAILAVNHLSYFDGPMVLAMLPRRVRPMAAERLRPAATVEGVEIALRSKALSIEKSSRELGYAPRPIWTSLEETIMSVLRRP